MSSFPVILHIPHDSKVIPEDLRHQILLDDTELQAEIIYMTDSHTAELYEYGKASRIIFPVSRLILDPERFADDAQEPMAERGMGVVYTITSHLNKLRAILNAEEKETLLKRYYHPHHQRLTDAAQVALESFGKCLIIDCHSFPSKTLPYELKDGTESRPEICIGTDKFHTPSGLTEKLFNYFKDKGYDVDIDTPFAGALTPLKYYGKESNVLSVMYEIRRDLYMNEETGEKNTGFEKVKKDITESIDILNEWIS